jgi:hypothetical protein
VGGGDQGGATAGGGGAAEGGGRPAHCDDGTRDDGETGMDCGGGECPACGVGDGCDVGADCESKSCPAHTCVPPTCRTRS